MSKSQQHPDVTFCQKWLNHRAGMTFSEVAEKTGVSTRWLSYLAKGEIENPTMGRIHALKSFIVGKRAKQAA